MDVMFYRHDPYYVKSLVLPIKWILPDSKVREANMGPIWDLSAPDGPHVGLMNLAIWATDHGLTRTILLLLWNFAFSDIFWLYAAIGFTHVQNPISSLDITSVLLLQKKMFVFCQEIFDFCQIIHFMILKCGHEFRCETIFGISGQFQESVFLGYTVVLEPHNYVISWYGRVINVEWRILQARFMGYFIRKVLDMPGIILTHCPLGDLAIKSIIFKMMTQNSSSGATKLLSDKCHSTSIMRSQHWLRWWPGAIRQQAITWWPRSMSPYGVTGPQWVKA